MAVRFRVFFLELDSSRLLEFWLGYDTRRCFLGRPAFFFAPHPPVVCCHSLARHFPRLFFLPLLPRCPGWAVLLPSAVLKLSPPKRRFPTVQSWRLFAAWIQSSIGRFRLPTYIPRPAWQYFKLVLRIRARFLLVPKFFLAFSASRSYFSNARALISSLELLLNICHC